MNITFNYENINFSVSEYPFPDTVNFRPHLPFPDKEFARSNDYTIDNENHYYKNIVINKVTVQLDLIRSDFAQFFDIKVSLAKLFFSGSNSQGFKRKMDFDASRGFKLGFFKSAVQKYSGISEFNPFKNPLSRFDVALNFQCKNQTEAEMLREYFDTRKIPYLTNRRREENTAYWNNKAAFKRIICSDSEKYRQPNRTFAVYVTEKHRVRLETRLYNRKEVTSLKSKVKFKGFNLENNLGSLLDWNFMNHFFWRDAINLFDSEDRKKIIKAYKL